MLICVKEMPKFVGHIDFARRRPGIDAVGIARCDGDVGDILGGKGNAADMVRPYSGGIVMPVQIVRAAIEILRRLLVQENRRDEAFGFAAEGGRDVAIGGPVVRRLVNAEVLRCGVLRIGRDGIDVGEAAVAAAEIAPHTQVASAGR